MLKNFPPALHSALAFFLLLGFFWVPGQAMGRSLTDEQVLTRAEAAYRKGLAAYGISLKARKYFARAATGFEELHRRGARNPALDANLGQSYLLAGDLPRAILSFRRGLRRDPGNRLLQSRLQEAREQVVYPLDGPFARPPVDNWPPWLPHLSTGLRLTVALALFTLACVGFTRWGMTRQGWQLGVSVFAFAVTAFLCVGLALEEHDRVWEKDHPLVVIAADQVFLHKGDGRNYSCYDAQERAWLEVIDTPPPNATPLQRGVEARLRFARGDWLQIELAGGEIGWVPRKSVLVSDQ
jgi:hypothetical protein